MSHLFYFPANFSCIVNALGWIITDATNMFTLEAGDINSWLWSKCFTQRKNKITSDRKKPKQDSILMYIDSLRVT